MVGGRLVRGAREEEAREGVMVESEVYAHATLRSSSAASQGGSRTLVHLSCLPIMCTHPAQTRLRPPTVASGGDDGIGDRGGSGNGTGGSGGGNGGRGGDGNENAVTHSDELISHEHAPAPENGNSNLTGTAYARARFQCLIKIEV